MRPRPNPPVTAGTCVWRVILVTWVDRVGSATRGLPSITNRNERLPEVVGHLSENESSEAFRAVHAEHLGKCAVSLSPSGHVGSRYFLGRGVALLHTFQFEPVFVTFFDRLE